MVVHFKNLSKCTMTTIHSYALTAGWGGTVPGLLLCLHACACSFVSV